jgi:hypothetical protein
MPITIWGIGDERCGSARWTDTGKLWLLSLKDGGKKIESAVSPLRLNTSLTKKRAFTSPNEPKRGRKDARRSQKLMLTERTTRRFPASARSLPNSVSAALLVTMQKRPGKGGLHLRKNDSVLIGNISLL